MSRVLSSRCFWLGSFLLGCATLAGCATHADHLRQVRGHFYSGDLAAAESAIERALAKERTDADVLRLEKAMICLVDGRAGEAEQILREVRDRFDHLEQTSVGEAAWSLVSDDNQQAYAGEDYEKVLIRAFLAMANLMRDGADAGAYALQVADKQQQIIHAAAGPDPFPDPQAGTPGAQDARQNPKLAYKQVALGPYLRGVIAEESHVNYDDAARSFHQVVSWAPSFEHGRRDLERATHGRHSRPGNGALYVFTLVGRGPYKEEVVEAPTSAALFIADAALRATSSQYKLPPAVAPIKVAQVAAQHEGVDGVLVSVDGMTAGCTEPIADIGQMAVEQYAAVRDHVVAKAVVRRIVKKGTVAAAKDALDSAQNPLLNLALDVGGVAWEAAEAADTRCWGLLPDTIQVRRLELPAGVHTIALQPAWRSQPVGASEQARVRIDDGRNTYLLAAFPGARLVGAISVSP